MILGHDFWEQQFGGDRSILGRTVRLNGIEFTVVGVAPPAFTGLDQFARFDFYAPLMMWPRLMTDPDAPAARGARFPEPHDQGTPEARRDDDAGANGAVASSPTDLERAYPDTNRNRRLAVRTELQNRIATIHGDAALLAMLTTLAGAVLFVACANVAGLLTSRAPVRAREIALRLAIGAGRARLIRQLITESVLIAVLGGVLGLGVGLCRRDAVQADSNPDRSAGRRVLRAGSPRAGRSASSWRW